MSNFLLEKICDYLRKDKITVRFSLNHCIEEDIYYMSIYDKEENLIERFNIKKFDMDAIKLIAKVENLQRVY